MLIIEARKKFGVVINYQSLLNSIWLRELIRVFELKKYKTSLRIIRGLKIKAESQWE